MGDLGGHLPSFILIPPSHAPITLLFYLCFYAGMGGRLRSFSPTFPPSNPSTYHRIQDRDDFRILLFASFCLCFNAGMVNVITMSSYFGLSSAHVTGLVNNPSIHPPTQPPTHAFLALPPLVQTAFSPSTHPPNPPTHPPQKTKNNRWPRPPTRSATRTGTFYTSPSVPSSPSSSAPLYPATPLAMKPFT